MSTPASTGLADSDPVAAVLCSPNQSSIVMSALGESVEGRVIQVYVRGGSGSRTTVVFGAFHGDEPKTVHVARHLIDLLAGDATAGGDGTWVVVPVVNPDGFARRNRRNANRVDLNRNFPTQSWTVGKRRSRMYGGAAPASEPETRAVIDLIEQYQPTRAITIHSIGANRFCNNYDGPGRALAEAMSGINAYPVTESIGYPTPGSFGAWCGVERHIPTITLELPSHHSSKRCWADNRDALLVCA